MTDIRAQETFTAHEAACVTGVPVDRVRRLLASGLLGPVGKNAGGARIVPRDRLAALKLVHDTAGILTREGRRRLAARLVETPEAATAVAGGVSVDAAALRAEAERGLDRLARARELVVARADVQGGAPCIAGTRAPAHIFARMNANGDSVADLAQAWSPIAEEQVEAAILYTRAYPYRETRRTPFWRKAGWKVVHSSKSTRDAVERGELQPQSLDERAG